MLGLKLNHVSKRGPGWLEIQHSGSRIIPHSNVHGVNMAPSWDRQDPGGPHVGHMNLAIWDNLSNAQVEYLSSIAVTSHAPAPWCLISPVTIVFSNSLFRLTSTNASMFASQDFWEGNPPVTGEFPSQKAYNTESVSISLCCATFLIYLRSQDVPE